MNLKELQQRKAQLLADAAGFIDKIGAATDEQLPGVMAEFETAKADVAFVDTKIKALQELDKLNASNAPAYTSAAVQVNDRKNGFSDLADFALAVRASAIPGGQFDPRLAAPTNPVFESGSAEGFLVPPALAQQIWDVAYGDESSLLRLMNLTPTTSNSIDIYKNEETAYSTNGIRAYWVDESGVITNSKPNGKVDNFKVHKLACLVPVSEEIKQDAPRVTNLITTQAARALNFMAADALVNGNGIGKPLGFAAAGGALVTQAKESGQAADTIVAANVTKMRGQLLSTQGGSGSFWLISSSAFAQLLTLTVGNFPVFQPNFRDGASGVLFGLPVYETELCGAIGDLGDIYLVNPDGYAGFIRTGIEGAVSMHLYFDSQHDAYRWTMRLGGKPYLSAPIAQNKGSLTKSHFVTLEAR
jgi:HK97 family phage major capsid protein